MYNGTEGGQGQEGWGKGQGVKQKSAKYKHFGDNVHILGFIGLEAHP